MADGSRRLSLFQIGDVHFGSPDFGSEFDSDSSGEFSASFTLAAGGIRSRRVAQVLMQELRARDGLKHLVLMGDVSNKGDLKVFQEGMEYIVKLCKGSLSDTECEKHISSVPGNHDIDRSLHDDKSLDKKFLELNKILDSFGLQQFSLTTSLQTRTLKSGATDVELFLLNSCYGCGALLNKKPVEHDELVKFLRDHAYPEERPEDPAAPIASAPADRRELLDIPLIPDQMLLEVGHRVSERTKRASNPGSYLPVLVSHHNLLPQALPRIKMYGELLNAGRVRTTIEGLNRTVLYLHGHIHDDPVEILHHPKFKQSKLIAISAPAFRRGFNIIDFYENDYNQIYAVEVSAFRVTESGGSLEAFTTPISLLEPRDIIKRLPKDDLRVLNSIDSLDIEHFSVCYSRFSKSNGKGKLSELDFKERIQRLARAGLLSIENKDLSTDSWRLSRW